MTIITRRNALKLAAASVALPMFNRAGYAADPLKVGFIYLGPIGDAGWTWAHNKGRLALVDGLGGKATAD